MSKRKTDNSLYEFLRGSISNALPLEYAIRASESLYPNETGLLRDIDRGLFSYWVGKGFSADDIERERLLDYSWDVVQVGFPLVRRHSKKFGKDLLLALHRSFADLPVLFGSAYEVIQIPTSKYFRICDLLHGNDIRRLFEETMVCIKIAQQYEKQDEIDPRHLPSISIREPIRLHPSMTYIQSSLKPNSFGALFDLDADISTADFIRQVQELIYQFAVYRSSVVEHDTLSRDLIQAFLEKDLRGDSSENQVERIDGFASLLSGLYCWDLRKREGLTEVASFAEIARIYGKSDDAMRKNYRKASRMIKASMARISDVAPSR